MSPTWLPLLFSATNLLLAASAPDWVKGSGTTARFTTRTHMLGFAVVERENELDSAKAQAAADLASRISVRIESQVSDVQSEKDGQQKYAVASLTKASTDVKLSGLAYETHVSDGKTYALAILARDTGAVAYKTARDNALRAAHEKLESGKRAEADKRESDALKAYLQVRPLLAETLESDAIVRVLLGGSDDKVGPEAAQMMTTVDERVTTLLRRPVSSLRDAAQVLALQLAQQGLGANEQRGVSPFTYGTTSFSSAFGREFANDVDAALATALTAKSDAAQTLALRGNYTERSDKVRVLVMVSNTQTGKVIASAETEFAKSVVPKEMALLPQNFQQALKDQKILAAGEEVSGNLRLELWTDKGRSNLVYREKESMKIFMRVNRPAYVRLVYVLAKNGMKVPLTQAYYIDDSKVNLAVEFPDTFEVSPPFGIEHIQGVAFTEKPMPLPTQKVVVDGEDYEIVSDTQTLVKHRGIKVQKAAAQSAEALVSITTTK